MNYIAEDILMHYGIPRRSGRYPWGSGDDPYQHGGKDFLGRIDELKKQGWSETPENIQKEFGLTTSQYRTEKALAKNERRMLNVATAKSLMNKKYNKSWVVFQPHTYSRTKTLLTDFAKALLNFDNIIILDIYAARESNTYGITSKDLADKINPIANKPGPTAMDPNTV